MRGNLDEIPDSWDFPVAGSHLPDESVSMIKFLSEKVFNDYEPSQFSPFKLRLLEWLNNFDDESDQQHLLALLMDVFFVGRKEFEALYRTVYHGILFRWMLEDEDIDIFSDKLEYTISKRINEAWICPISDSLRINSFLKVNGLKSLDKRPDWRSMKQFGDVQKIRSYVAKKKIRDLVLLEDFSGSGDQATDAIKFAAKALPKTRILLCPLIVCPNGDDALANVAKTLDNVRYDPALVLPKGVVHDFKEHKAGNGSPSDKFLCDIKKMLHYKKDESMFGYRQTGAKVVLFSNCPNNTLPIFHRETAQWKPLFPRVNRQ